MKHRRILIVEDEVILAESHKDKLMSMGLEKILLAKTKEEAITMLSLHAFDLILLDVRLDKDFEGIELGEYIQEKYATPFIYLTAYSDKTTIEKIIRSKPYGYLSKPVRKSDLMTMITLVFGIADKDFVVLTEAGTNYKFERASITHAVSSGNYMELNFSNKEKPFLYRSTIDNLLKHLGDDFIKINRSTVVNTKHIKFFNKKEVLVDESLHKISKDVYSQLLKTP